MFTQSKLFLITYCLAGVQSLVVNLGRASETDGSVLDRYVGEYERAREQMNPNSLQVAERFADELGTGRMYQFDLNTFKGSYDEPASLQGLQQFKSNVRQLAKVSDADATIQLLRQLDDHLRYEQLEDSNLASQLVDTKLVPACDEFVKTMYASVFGQPDLLAALKSTQLHHEVAMKGKSNQVKQFLMGWAQFHICKLLVHQDRRPLADRIGKRSSELKRISAKYGYKS